MWYSLSSSSMWGQFKEFFLSLTARQIVSKIKHYRLHRDDFEVIRIIGKGAFGEVRKV